MAIIAGIDEAGYGPILGPLVITATAFKVPDDMLRADMWKVLEKGVGKQKRTLAGRLLVTDSKKAYNRKQGPLHLRRTTLAAMACCNGQAKQPIPSETQQLLGYLCPETRDRLGDYPWYSGLPSHKLGHDEADIRIAAGVLSRALAGADMEMAFLKSNCLDVGYYNHLVETVKNKARVSFTAVCGLINDMFEQFRGQTLQIIVDRQGGRTAYRQPLQRMFPQMDIAIIKEEPSISSYELTDGDRKMRLHFTIKADDNFLPVALASMASKYIREIMMEVLNDHFVDTHSKANPNTPLKRTAGYWQDGLRFIKDLEDCSAIKFDRTKLIRIK